MQAGRSEARAVAAACAVARDNGIPCDRPALVHSGSNVVVHLWPAPVIARVMTGTVVLHDDPQRWLSREVSVLNFLASSGTAVRPSSLIGPGPYHQSGLWLTFWEWIGEHTEAGLDSGPDRLGRALRDLHEALSGFTGELGNLLDLQHDIARLHRQLRPSAALSRHEIHALRSRLIALTGPVFAAASPMQALHGDVSLSNLLRVNERLVWNDFEDTFRGPVEWDLAGFAMSLRARGADSTFVAQALDAYGCPDERAIAPFIEAHAVYDEIWRLYVAQRQL